jgi:THO complex subunit 4
LNFSLVVSILARVGEKESTSQGTKVLVKNLKFDILEDDVRELFSTVGEVTKAEIIYDRTGRSKGVARVWFAKRSDAEKAIKQYDGKFFQVIWLALESMNQVKCV